MTHGQRPSLRRAKELEIRADPAPRSTFDIFDNFDVDSYRRQNEKKKLVKSRFSGTAVKVDM